MAFNFASAKASLRRAIHTTLGVDATYEDRSLSVPVPIRARFHNKIALAGDPENAGYAEMVEGVHRIVLIPGDTPDLEFKRGGKVTDVATGEVYSLDLQHPSSGPLEQIWQATK